MALFLAPSSQSKIGNNNGLIFGTKIETQIFKMSLAVLLFHRKNCSTNLRLRCFSSLTASFLNFLLFGLYPLGVTASLTRQNVSIHSATCCITIFLINLKKKKKKKYIEKIEN
jgi:hypothetical protein